MSFDTHLMHLLEKQITDTISDPRLGRLDAHARLRGLAIEHIAKTHRIGEEDAVWVLEALLAVFCRKPSDVDPLNLDALKVLELT
jgi:hypothetical protein